MRPKTAHNRRSDFEGLSMPAKSKETWAIPLNTSAPTEGSIVDDGSAAPIINEGIVLVTIHS